MLHVGASPVYAAPQSSSMLPGVFVQNWLAFFNQWAPHFLSSTSSPKRSWSQAFDPVQRPVHSSVVSPAKSNRVRLAPARHALLSDSHVIDGEEGSLSGSSGPAVLTAIVRDLSSGPRTRSQSKLDGYRPSPIQSLVPKQRKIEKQEGQKA